MSINRIVIWVVVAGYTVVNVLMQIDFFAGRNIFAKYQETATAVDALRVAEKAYYAKTSWPVLLLILSAFGVPFALAFALSMSVYVIIMQILVLLTPPRSSQVGLPTLPPASLHTPLRVPERFNWRSESILKNSLASRETWVRAAGAGGWLRN